LHDVGIFIGVLGNKKHVGIGMELLNVIYNHAILKFFSGFYLKRGWERGDGVISKSQWVDDWNVKYSGEVCYLLIALRVERSDDQVCIF